jgi:hypothetical protein
MWATLALASALGLAPNQAGTLQLKNERVTYGILGPERKDAKLLPGDIFVVAFDIDGLRVREDGRVLYSMGMELTNSQGKSQFKREPQDLEAVNALGGSRLPAFAMSEVGTETPPGEYTMKVTVTDRLAMKTQTLDRKFEVLPAKLGVVRVHTSYNEQGTMPAPPVAVPGQTLYLNFAVVGFDLDTKQQPNLEAELNIFDESGKPTLAKPFNSGAIVDALPEFKKIMPMQFIVQLNRSGKYRLALKATDRLGKKPPVELSMDIAVVEPKAVAGK